MLKLFRRPTLLQIKTRALEQCELELHQYMLTLEAYQFNVKKLQAQVNRLRVEVQGATNGKN